MLHKRWIGKFGLAVVLALLTRVGGNAARASLIDPLDTTGNFDGGFGGTTATANGDGTVTLTRTGTGDAGVSWMTGGITHIPLQVDTNQLEVIPVSLTETAFYSVSILFFDNNDAFLGEPYWILNSTSTAPQTLPDVSAVASANSISGEAFYMLRFRIQTSGAPPASATFTEIDAVPEPATIMMLTPAMLLAARRRRS